jgi:hypothetical protein
MECGRTQLFCSAPAAHTDLTIVAFRFAASSSAFRRPPPAGSPPAASRSAGSPHQACPPQVRRLYVRPRRSVLAGSPPPGPPPAVPPRRRSASCRVASSAAAAPRSGTRSPYSGLRGANLKRRTLRTRTLLKATCRRRTCGGRKTAGADLVRRRNLRGTDLRGADIEAANLRGASLVGGDLRNAKLRGANLQGRSCGTRSWKAANLKATIVRSCVGAGADNNCVRPHSIQISEERGPHARPARRDAWRAHRHLRTSNRPAHCWRRRGSSKEASSDEEVADTPKTRARASHLVAQAAKCDRAVLGAVTKNGGVQNCASTSRRNTAAPRRPRRAGRPTSDCRSLASATRQQCSELSRLMRKATPPRSPNP